MTVAPGVVHDRGTMTTSTSGRQAVYIARVDMSQPVIRFEASISNDRIAGLETVTSQANRKNREGHRATTGPEIWRQTGGKIDAFTCACGSGGTLAGVGMALKAHNPNVRIVLADPEGRCSSTACDRA